MPMPAPTFTPEALDVYREQADEFLSEMVEEYYLHYAGLKDELAVEDVYERHADLTTLEAATRLGATVDGDRGVQRLWEFACDGYLGNLTKTYEARAAELEATLEATVGGETVPFRMLRAAIANEPDRERRRELELARCQLVDEQLNPLYLQATELVNHGVRDLGAASYLDLHLRFGQPLEHLAEQCRSFLAETERLYERSADALFRSRVGVGLDEAERWDTARMVRAPQWDPLFPPDRMVPALEATLAGFGIDLRSQRNVELDLEPREKKSPRAFCAPIRLPGRIVLVVKPMGGPDDWGACFHEAGHTEHYAHTSPDLPVESRRLGDNAVTEGWAFLLEHLTIDPAWLARRLDFPRPREFAAESAAVLLYAARRYCAKLLYELELHRADDPRPLRSRYVELLGDALKIEPSPTDWLADVDAGFYVGRYLRAWAFEAQIADSSRQRFGSEWFSRREAGSLLRELWTLGQAQTAEELLRDVAGVELDLAAAGELIGNRLAGS